MHKFIWTSECTVAYKEIKRHLVTTPLLHPPDMEKEFFMWINVSEKGFGAVLEQEARRHRRKMTSDSISKQSYQHSEQ